MAWPHHDNNFDFDITTSPPRWQRGPFNRRGLLFLDRPGPLECGLIEPFTEGDIAGCPEPGIPRLIADLMEPHYTVCEAKYYFGRRAIELNSTINEEYEAMVFVFRAICHKHKLRGVGTRDFHSPELPTIDSAIKALRRVYAGKIIPVVIFEIGHAISSCRDHFRDWASGKPAQFGDAGDINLILSPEGGPFIFAGDEFATNFLDGKHNKTAKIQFRAALDRAAMDPLRLWPTASMRKAGIAEHLQNYSAEEAALQLRAYSHHINLAPFPQSYTDDSDDSSDDTKPTRIVVSDT